jgi:Holliday junction DNA helicase RuvB
MASLNESLSLYLKQATAQIASGEYEKARKNLMESAKCALLLAKTAKGAEQKKYLDTYELLKRKIAEVDAKASASSVAPKKVEVKADPKPEPKIDYSVQNANNKPSYTPSTTSGSTSKGYNGQKGAEGFTGSLSPRWLSDYIGQPQAVTAVKDLIDAARLKDSALPHIILYGSHGLGKSTFSKIIANEMGSEFIEMNVTNATPAEMIAILKKLKPRDILFIDEIHTLPLQVAEAILYSAMQDGRVVYTEGKGKLAKTETLELPPFTLIGATTEIGKLAKPFTHRAIQVRLEEYTDEVLARIISSSFYKLGYKISNENALVISKRCRSNPRTANNMVRRISDKALVEHAKRNNLTDKTLFSSPEKIRKLDINISDTVISTFFDENGIDANGLEVGDRELLKIMVERYGGGPVGLETLARAMNESPNVLSGKYEAYLVRRGMLKVEREGRVVMADGYRALGLPVPQKLLDEEKEAVKANGGEDEKPKSKYDRRKLIACLVPDEIKCQMVEELIVYPENAVIDETPLDELFPDVEKPYEAETKHLCELEIDFNGTKRLLICDSFLESRFATAMASTGYLKDMKAQTLEIPYISQMLANRRYFPDFVIRDYKGRIAVIEMKNFDAVCYHLNIDKYEKLVQFCKERGYGYAEVMKAYNAEKYISTDMIAKMPRNEQLEKYIIDTIENKGEFTVSDWDNYNAQYGKVEKTEIYTILLNNRRLRNIDKEGTALKITSI